MLLLLMLQLRRRSACALTVLDCEPHMREGLDEQREIDKRGALTWQAALEIVLGWLHNITSVTVHA
jgi:hypothetical protein